MNAERLQTWIMIVTVALLLVAIVRIYETFQQKVPLNLQGHVEIEGSMTANPPPSDFGSAPPAMQ